jgi:hypothetical protein
MAARNLDDYIRYSTTFNCRPCIYFRSRNSLKIHQQSMALEKMNTSLTITRPAKIVVAAAVARAWKPGGHIFTRKYDGIWVNEGVRVGTCTFIAEKVSMKSGAKLTASDRNELEFASVSGRVHWFYAVHSIAVYGDHYVTHLPASNKWDTLCQMFKGGALMAEDGARIVLADSGPGGEFFEAVCAAGGEGVCAVPYDAPWGLIYAAKPMIEVKARVMAIDIARGTAELADLDGQVSLGRVVCRGLCPAVRVGSILDIECISRHKSGCLREARVVGVRQY